MSNVVDFTIHDVVTVRLIDATKRDVTSVSRQLGQEPSRAVGEIDITLRFCKTIARSGFTYLGLNSAAYDQHGFYVIQGDASKGTARIPFDRIGDTCELLCESGGRSVPLLNFIVNLTFIRKHHVPVHAAAFSTEGTGVLVMAWATGGKTEALLAFAERGAKYVGDEWVVLTPSGTMFGIPTRTSIKEWQFKQIPRLNPRMGFQRRIFIGCVSLLDRAQRLASNVGMGGWFAVKGLRSTIPLLQKQQKIWVMPREFFQNQFCDHAVPIDKVFMIMMHDQPRVTTEPGDIDAIAKRMVSSHEFEYASLFRHYSAYKFAFPDRRNELIDNLASRQYELLAAVLNGKNAHVVKRPYPVSLDAVYESMVSCF